MANPNIVNVTAIYGKLATSDPGQATNLFVNRPSVGSNVVLKINAIYVSNDTTGAVTANIQIGGVTLANISVPANSTLDVLNRPLYLTEDSTSNLVCTAATGLDYVVSYEEIS